MSRISVLAIGLSALGALTAPAIALEKTAAPWTDDEGPWTSQSTCRVVYYNFCTGWSWVWSGWRNGSVFGLVVDSCCPGGLATLETSWIYVSATFPSGWGFTGSTEVRDVDASGCLTGPVWASQIFFPVLGWNGYAWGIPVPSRYALTVTLGAGTGYGFPQPATPIAIDTDRPAAGPTGPLACGLCYPADRPTHSFRWGLLRVPRCPGLPFFDGTCNAELRWEVGLSCAVSVERTSWGQIKSLYR